MKEIATAVNDLNNISSKITFNVKLLQFKDKLSLYRTVTNATY